MNLVTGGTGLTGSWLLLELSKRNEPIRALKRKNTDLTAVENLFREFLSIEHFEKIEWVEGDLLDLPSLDCAFSGIETLYHTAALVSFDVRHRKQIYRSNVIGVENVVNTALAHKVKNLICFSSISTLDEDENQNQIDENSKWNPELPHSWYAISKKRTEMEFYRAGEELTTHLLILNPGVIIGSYDGHRPSEKLFERAFKKTAYATNGQTAYVDVRDVAYCAVEIAKRELWNQKFVLAAGNMKFSEVFDLLRENRNMNKTRILSDSKIKWLKKFSFLSGFLGGRVIDRATYAALTGKSVYNNEKVKQMLNFSFIPVQEALSFHSERYLKITKSQKLNN